MLVVTVRHGKPWAVRSQQLCSDGLLRRRIERSLGLCCRSAGEAGAGIREKMHRRMHPVMRAQQ
jgi:hypothetical protein